jgi:transposase InsO family protein
LSPLICDANSHDKGVINLRKEWVRKEAIKLRLKYKSYAKIQWILKQNFEYEVSRKTLKRWWERFNEGDWNLRDLSKRPYKLNYKFYVEDIESVISMRQETGYSSYQIKRKLEEKGIFISESSIKRIVKGIGLSRGSKMEGKRLKWIRFERDTPNSMWQIDGTEFNGKWIVPVLDDCSRYCLAIRLFNHNTTANMIALLEQGIAMHGRPREVLTDNGSEFGGRSKHSEFDKWCRKQGIKHIRSGIHKPTTVGKISRLQFTIISELPYCFNDLEYFRWRYNCDRPHRSLNGLTPHEVFFGWARHKKYLLEKKFMIQGI